MSSFFFYSVSLLAIKLKSSQRPTRDTTVKPSTIFCHYPGTSWTEKWRRNTCWGITKTPTGPWLGNQSQLKLLKEGFNFRTAAGGTDEWGAGGWSQEQIFRGSISTDPEAWLIKNKPKLSIWAFIYEVWLQKLNYHNWQTPDMWNSVTFNKCINP